ncbi:GerAB/ArcD/ProY family transporter [Metabacillus indicus]|uniref:GerAB/ArcD/ProY family transporter n=1 Tax=Metabacillus indicus TaxID=246786 RepID=UPI00055284DB|nr:GerAB/ArcD/ProY family transporter [Metabacillus indicus]
MQNIKPKPQELIPALLVFFIIHSAQLGVGVQGYQRIIYQASKQDAWISVILSGAATCIIGFIMLKTLSKYETADIYFIHNDIFGKWIGFLFNTTYVVYCLGALLTILRNYIEVVQAWMFPELPTWFLAFTLMVLVLYGVLGGLRVVVGVSFFSVVLSLWMLLLLSYPAKFSNWTYLLPIFESDLSDIFLGAYQMTFTVIGFELIYTVYPFIKNKKEAMKYTQLGLIYTTLLYTFLIVISLAYFSGDQLKQTIWGTLSLFKIVRLPFIERFEYVAIAFWMLIIIPNLMLYLWAATRGVSGYLPRKEKLVIILFVVAIILISQMFKTRIQINEMNNYFAIISFCFVFCYPVILYLLAAVKNRSRKV